jgi:hypothetical protein
MAVVYESEYWVDKLFYKVKEHDWNEIHSMLNKYNNRINNYAEIKDRFGNTILHQVISQGEGIDNISFILKYIDVNTPGYCGFLPIHTLIVSQCNYMQIDEFNKIVDLLIEHGANLIYKIPKGCYAGLDTTQLARTMNDKFENMTYIINEKCKKITS